MRISHEPKNPPITWLENIFAQKKADEVRGNSF